MNTELLSIYFFIINWMTFFTWGIDKWKARHHRWRISEAMLLSLAALGGSIGAIAGMLLFHHKTRKSKFVIGVPVILAIQILLFLFYR